MTHYIKLTIFFLAMMILLAGCAGGRSSFGKAEKLEHEGKLDEALIKYAEIATANPDVGEYRVRFLKVSEAAARAHSKKGENFLTKKMYDEALQEFQTAFAMDPSQEVARQQSVKVIKLRNSTIFYQEGVEFENNRKPREALNSYQKAVDSDQGNKEAKSALERLIRSKQPKLEGYDLNLKSSKPITLKFKDAKIKDIFSIISQLSGINFIFDDSLKDVNVTFYIENATFQQTLEIICGINKLGKKVLNESTVIVYAKTPEKSKQYDELFVQTFYLNKLDSKKAVNLIRTMLQVKKIYVNEEMNAIVIRDTREVIDVARKILEANDIPDAEVLLEIEVVELAKKNADNFGLALSRYAVSANVVTPGGKFFSDTFNPAAPTSGATATVDTANLLHLFNYKGYGGYLTVPNATFNFGKTLANGETLSNPKIRVKNREKAKFNVGTRVPITTTSSPTGGGVSVNVQYVDVGVKVNAEPTIQLNNEVSIKLGLEVSSILQKEAVGTDKATTVVTIGTRNLDTVLSLKDGETSIIGGLIQDIKNDSKDKISILGDIPFLGALFSNQSKSNDKTELLLAITPRIIRSVTIPDVDVAAFWSGREDDPSIVSPYSSLMQESENPPVPTTPSKAPLPPPIQQKQGVNVVPTVDSQSAEKASAGPTTSPVTTAPAAVALAPAVPAMQAPGPVLPENDSQMLPKIMLSLVAPAKVAVNEQFAVQINAGDLKNLNSAQFTLRYNPILLECVGISQGDLFKQKGASKNFISSVDKRSGQVTILGQAEWKDGAGTVAVATFRALTKGGADLGFENVYFLAPGGKQFPVVPFSTLVEVK